MPKNSSQQSGSNFRLCVAPHLSVIRTLHLCANATKASANMTRAKDRVDDRSLTASLVGATVATKPTALYLRTEKLHSSHPPTRVCCSFEGCARFGSKRSHRNHCLLCEKPLSVAHSIKEVLEGLSVPPHEAELYQTLNRIKNKLS